MMSEESMLPPADTDTGGSEGESATTNNEPESSWLWGENVPGTGDAPEWFNSAKYKSIADQAKAYPELEKKFG